MWSAADPDGVRALRDSVAIPPTTQTRLACPEVQHVHMPGGGRFVAMVAQSTHLPEVWLCYRHCDLLWHQRRGVIISGTLKPS
jgi:hypothetical protein